MQYSSPIITPPIRWNTPSFDIPLGVSGDTIFITPIPSINRELTLPPVDNKIPLTPKAHIRIVEVFEDVSGVVLEGDTLNITVALSKPSPVDIECQLQITHDALPDVSPDWRRDKDVEGVVDNTNYIAEYFTDTTDADFANTNITLTIPAGQTSFTQSISTVDDGVLQRGKGSYKVGKISIVSQDNPDYMIHHSKGSSTVLLEDSSDYPVWGGGEVYLWCKLGKLCEWEPILDETGTQAKLIFDWDKHENGVVTDFLGHTYPIDIVPIHAIQLRPDQTTLPTDVDEAAPVDISANLPSFRVQIVARQG